jgi:hypothetical protein
MSIDEREEVASQSTGNIKIAEKFPYLEKEMPIQVQEASRMPKKIYPK